MEKTIVKFIFLLICISVSFQSITAKNRELDSILTRLDEVIKQKVQPVEAKEQRIAELKHQLRISDISDAQSYELNNKLHDEYKSFKSDSAIVYLLKNIGIAQTSNNSHWLNESRLNLSWLYAIGGRYIEAKEQLMLVSATKPTEAKTLIHYYDTYKQLFYYYPKTDFSAQYRPYRDSLLNLLNPQSDNYKLLIAEKLMDDGKPSNARAILLPIFINQKGETHWRAVLAFSIGETYIKVRDFENAKKFYAISAIADISNAIKENASLRALATVFYETKDIERAYTCVKQSLDDAIFSNARLRTMEVSQIFPIIEQAYQDKLQSQNKRLVFMLICIAILSAFLLLAIIYVYIQLRHLASMKKSLSETNERLQQLNYNLNEANSQLAESNQLKETYISQFLSMCSMYIDKLENYRSSLNRILMEKKLDELARTLKSRDMVESELKELFNNFDKIFLALYPHYIEEFNALLIPDEQFNLKSNELLNPELRIFALIRLGITDSNKIAAFLRYSSTTIYNYRTRVRNKSAVPRDEFESHVMRIGQISK